ncbi:hypothetical protein TNCV_4003831 [Trichonephila clavipes]|nr:hypothetical protein TNCV_4003831 [Trichonephila clavipes]
MNNKKEQEALQIHIKTVIESSPSSLPARLSLSLLFHRTNLLSTAMSKPNGHPPLLVSRFQEMNPEFLKKGKELKKRIGFPKEKKGIDPETSLRKSEGGYSGVETENRRPGCYGNGHRDPREYFSHRPTTQERFPTIEKKAISTRDFSL